MKEKAVKVTNKTKQAIVNAYEVVAMTAAIAAAVKVASLPLVQGQRVWQAVAGVILAGVAVKVYTLLNK